MVFSQKEIHCEAPPCSCYSPISTRRAAFSALQQQALGTLSAIHAGHALSAGVEAFRTTTCLHVIPVIATGDTLVVLQQERTAAGQAITLRGARARFARRVTGSTVAAVRVLGCCGGREDMG